MAQGFVTRDPLTRDFLLEDATAAALARKGLSASFARAWVRAQCSHCAARPSRKSVHSSAFVVDKLRRLPLTLISESVALVSDNAPVGSGTWVQAGSSIMPSARIGSHVALRSGCQVSHDCIVEDFASVGLGAIVCGYCVVRQGAHIAPGAIIRDRITVGRYSVVGLGAVVVEDFPDGAIVAGNPARIVGGLAGNSN